MSTNYEWQKHQVDERIRNRLHDAAQSRRLRSNGKPAPQRSQVVNRAAAFVVAIALLTVVSIWMF